MYKFPRNLRTKGATLSGYGLIVGLIAVLALASISTVGSQTAQLFGSVNTTLVAIGSPAPSPSASPDLCAGSNPDLGILCADGSFYIGIHPPSGDRMFADACDLGRTYDAATGRCTGVWDVMAFNDGSTNWLDVDSDGAGTVADDNTTTGQSASDYAGRIKTTALAAADSSS